MEIIARLFPGWALARERARYRLGLIRGDYQAARPTRTHPRRSSAAGPDTVMANAGWSLRNQARYLDENHDLVVGVHSDIVNRVVGTGLHMEQASFDRSGEPMTDFNSEVDILFRQWWQRPETTNELPGGEMERLICRSLVRDGEILVHHITGRRFPYVGPVPYVLELLEADYLPMELFGDNPLVVQGVEKNEFGKPQGYYVWKVHPGERGISSGSSIRARQETKRVSADAMTHLKHVKRLRQTRGVPIIHAVIQRLSDIKDYEESERIAARMNADVGGVIRNDPGYFGEKSDTDTEGDSYTEVQMDSGMWLTTVEGQDVKMMEATRPNTNLESFRHGQLRAVAAGTGTRASSISKNYEGSYSSQRQELVEGAIDYEKIRDYLIGVFYQPMRQRFIDAAVLAGQLRVPRALDPRSLHWCIYTGPPTPQIDIQKERKAHIESLQAGLVARSQVQREMGLDPQLTQAAIAREEPTQVPPADGQAGDEEERTAEGAGRLQVI